MVDNSKTYLRQMEESEVQKDFWSRLTKGPLQTYVWRDGQTKPYEMKGVQLVANAAIKLTASDDFQVKTISSEFPGLRVFLKFKVSEETQYFVSGDFELSGKDLVVHLKPPYFVTTKRSTCRYLTTEMDRIALTVAGHSFNCFDISSGGFSTEVKRDQYGGLTKGSAFEQVHLKYQLKNFTIPTVRLVNIMDVLGRPDWVRLAFKFEGMKPQDEDALWVEVNKSIKKAVDLMAQ